MDPVCGIALGFLYIPTQWSSKGLSEWAAAGQPRGCCAAVLDPLQTPRSPPEPLGWPSPWDPALCSLASFGLDFGLQRPQQCRELKSLQDFSSPLLACLGFSNKAPQTRWLRNNRNRCLAVTESGGLRSGAGVVGVLMGALFWAAGGCHFRCPHTMDTKAGSSLEPLFQTG